MTNSRTDVVSSTQYRSGLYYHDEEQKEAIEKKVEEVNEKLASGLWGKVSGRKVVSEVLPATDFYVAEKVRGMNVMKFDSSLQHLIFVTCMVLLQWITVCSRLACESQRPQS